MNNSLLTDIDYIDLIKTTIEALKEQYAPDNTNGEKINDSELKLTIDDHLFLETLLCELWGKTISYTNSSHIKKKNKDREQELLKMISYLEKKTQYNS